MDTRKVQLRFLIIIYRFIHFALFSVTLIQIDRLLLPKTANRKLLVIR